MTNRINEYNNLNEFIQEYDNLDHGLFVEKNIGIVIEYKNVFYRMCNEPLADEILPKKDGVICHICTYQNTEDDFSKSNELEWYYNLDDCLENWIIDGRKFKDVISDPNTRIVDKD